MDDFDRVCIEEAIRAVVGDIRSIELLDRSATSPLASLVGGPLASLVEAAEARFSRRVSVFLIDEGLPGHFTLDRADTPVVWHAREVQRSAFFRSFFLSAAKWT